MRRDPDIAAQYTRITDRPWQLHIHRVAATLEPA
jgi:hypothetical protein